MSFGSTAQVVAIVDTGIDYTHPDLAANVWSAPAAFTVTIGGTTVTCPAGSHGFNVITLTCNPMDDHNHGTHVSGTIGAVGGNGVGVVGVNWTTQLMGIKFLDANGSGSLADADQGDRLRHPGQARVCRDRRRERARPVEQLGRRRLLAGHARRNQRRQRRGHALRRGGRQQRVQQRRAAGLPGQLHARRT